MSEIENGRSGLYGTEHSKCNHPKTLGFKGLRTRWSLSFGSALTLDTFNEAVVITVFNVFKNNLTL